jgi:hypothetical protein
MCLQLGTESHRLLSSQVSLLSFLAPLPRGSLATVGRFGAPCLAFANLYSTVF